MSDCEIKRADACQIELIRKLTLAAYAKWVAVTPRKPRPMTADYDEAFEKHRFDFLHYRGEIVGLIETVQQDHELMIVNVAVEPSQQGKGFGSLLMRYAETVARDLGLCATRLYTNKLMTTNIALYERLGYVIEKETHHDLGTVAVHMVRPLARTPIDH